MEEKNFELEQKIKEFRNKQIEMDQKLTVLSEAVSNLFKNPICKKKL